MSSVTCRLVAADIRSCIRSPIKQTTPFQNKSNSCIACVAEIFFHFVFYLRGQDRDRTESAGCGPLQVKCPPLICWFRSEGGQQSHNCLPSCSVSTHFNLTHRGILSSVCLCVWCVCPSLRNVIPQMFELNRTGPCLSKVCFHVHPPERKMFVHFPKFRSQDQTRSFWYVTNMK